MALARLIEHEIVVGKLKEVLTHLEDDDVLIPNTVGNLAIFRQDRLIGVINLLLVETDSLELWV